jgi:exopolysaccharide production protein ExoQ
VLKLLEKPVTVLTLLLSTSAVYAVWINETSTSNLDTAGDVRGQIAWTAIYLVITVLLARRVSGLRRVIRTCRWPLSLVALAVVSILWSIDPDFSMHRILALVGTTIFGLYLGLRYSIADQLKLLAYALGLGALLTIAAVILIPDYAIMPDNDNAWRGVFVHKNTAGVYMALGVGVLILLAIAERRHRLLHSALAAICLMLVVFSHSATATVTLVSFVAVFLFSRILNMSWKLALASLGLTLPIMIALLLWSYLNFADVTALLDRSPTLTGRTSLWGFVMAAIARAPFLGYGYDSFWAANGREITRSVAGWESPHAHNGILELMLNLGLIGLLLFAAGFGTFAARAWRYAKEGNHALHIWPLLFLAHFSVYNTTLPGILERNNLLWVLFVALSCSLGEPREIAFSAADFSHVYEKNKREMFPSNDTGPTQITRSDP